MSTSAEAAKKYNSIKVRLKLADIAFTILYLVFFQILVSSFLKSFSFSISHNFYYTFTMYLIGFSIIHYIINLPMHFYSGFTLEHKFNLSKERISGWLKDDIKSGVLSLAVFLIFMHALYIFLRNFETTWWIWIAIFYLFATVILVKVMPVVVIPLFFKYSSLEDERKKWIIELSKKCGIKILDVYKIDLSKKTKKLNAAVVGLGRTRRVIVADTLLADFDRDELAGVLAHEFGHHKLRHMWKLITFSVVTTFLSYYALFLVASKLVIFLGAENIYDIKMFPAFMLVLFLAGLVILPIQNAFSRKLEKDADLFALKITDNKPAFRSLMKKLAEKNLADPNPPKLIKFLFYSHPPISERIKLAE